ncbi:MAG: hypothetical protein ACYC28_01715 [Longimicrobiales bacterium]
MRNVAKALCTALLACAVTSCGSDVLGPADFAGTYLLQTVTGFDEAPMFGTLRLDRNGEVERRLAFGETEYVWTGRHRVRGSALEIAFVPAGAEDEPLHYRPVEYDAGIIVLSYSQPNDGPDIVEIYQRPGPD